MCSDALAERVVSRCAVLAGHTEEPGRITRRYLSPPTKAVHLELTRWMQELGMQVRPDAAGNLVGRLGDPAPDTPVLLIGSHIDTVPNAGKYDGVLGVLVGLAVAEVLRDRDLPFAVDVVAFSEEEGVRFTKPYLGSAAIAGTYDPAWLERRDEDGVTLRGAIEAFGLYPDKIAGAAYHPDHVVGYLEAHIEQGPVLEREYQPVGIVTAIAGQNRLMLRFTGEPGHAGTTPMSPRKDALVGAARLIGEVQDYGQSIQGLRATVGYINAQPNTRNVIPGQVDLSLDIRHAMDDVREAAVAAIIDTAGRVAQQGGLTVEVLENQPQPAVAMDGLLCRMLREAMNEAALTPFELLSGAGHDAVAMAASFPVAMLFLRHPGGISHHPDERVDVGDVAVSVNVLARAALRLAGELEVG